MAYAILRFAKKKMGGVTAACAHNERKKEVYKSNPDIDATRKQENYHLVLPKQTYRREVVRLINAVAYTSLYSLPARTLPGTGKRIISWRFIVRDGTSPLPATSTAARKP